MMPDVPSGWLALLLLGAAHGINPAMGWLFAVSLGLQEGTGRAVWRALGPLALGHALAIGAALLAAALVGLVVPQEGVKWIAAAALLGFGCYHLLRHRHPRWGGMRVGAKDLTIWSFLMASAHGAGLMALPFLLSLPAPRGHEAHLPAAQASLGQGNGLTPSGLASPEVLNVLATALHTAGYLAVAGAIAFVVYRWLGLRLLRTAWINLDAIWACALIVTAVLTPLL